jgi:hypothetical protein
MERARTGPFPLVIPALVVLPLAGLALWFAAWRWFEADTRATLGRRLSDVAAAVERQLDSAVQRQAEATRTLATSPTTWLWVKFQGERLTVSNRAHAQAALASLSSFSGLVPGASLYLASERTRTVYQAGAAVAALSRGDPRDAWYAASLSTEGVVVSDDLRAVRTSMRVMNGPDVLGAVSCVTQVSSLAAEAFAAAEDEPGFSFVLSDRAGSIVLARGPRAAAAATVFDLFDPGERARLGAVLDAAARPGELAVNAFSANRRRVLAAATLTAAPGWHLVVSSELGGLPAGRSLAIVAVAAAALALIVGILLFIGTRRARRVEDLVDSLEEQRDAARHLARDLSEAALRLREAAGTLGERTGSLAAEISSARAGSARTLEAIGEAEARSAELRSGIAARLPLFSGLASGLRQALGGFRELRAGDALASPDAAAAAAAGAAEEEINVILTTGSGVTLALDNAGKGAAALAEAAERARLAALNLALQSSRPGSRRQGAAAAADEMRRIAEEAAAGTKSLVSAVEEARAGMRAVSRAAQEAGRRSHEAAAAGSAASAASAAPAGPVEPLRRLDETLQGLETLLFKLDSAATSAEALQGDAASSDRSRSAAEGMARITERMEALCGEISALASTVSRESSKAASRAATGG